MDSLALRRNLVVTPAAVILRRPGELTYIYTALLMGVGVAVFGLVYNGARPIAYVSILFGAIAVLLTRVRQRGGLYVTPETVSFRNGPRHEDLCAAPAVTKLLVLRVGDIWENYEEIRLLDSEGTVRARLKNESQSGRSADSWKHPDLRAFAGANGWECEIDTSKDHLTPPEKS